MYLTTTTKESLAKNLMSKKFTKDQSREIIDTTLEISNKLSKDLVTKKDAENLKISLEKDIKELKSSLEVATIKWILIINDSFLALAKYVLQ